MTTFEVGHLGAQSRSRAIARSGRQPLLRRPLTSYYLLLSLTAVLVVIGLVFVLSASSVRSFQTTGSSYTFVIKQLGFAVLGVGAMAVAVRVPMRVLRFASYPLLALSIAALAAVLVPGVGSSVSGATRWIDMGPIQLQPSEPAKLALALWSADVLVRKHQLLADWRHLVVPVIPVLTVVVFLVMAEPDMGTTMVIVAMVLGVLWVVGTPARIFGWLFGGVVALATFAALTEPYRFARLASFLHPFADAHGKGYQAVQGLFALGTGSFWGDGLGASREKWVGLLPNPHTDFIFAIIGEEVGLAGTLLVVGLFALLAYCGIRVARRTSDPYARLVAAGITTWLVGQGLINMATVVGLLPITGIPLPFISYGGTSLLLTMTAAGLLAACARTEPGAKQALAQRPGFARRLGFNGGSGGVAAPANVVELPGRRRSKGVNNRRGGPARNGRGPAARGRPAR